MIWEVENPFRFFKPTKSFALHEAAFKAVRGDPSAPPPADIIWRTERRLNDPDCKDASTPDRCAATAGKRYQQSRMGWAAQTLGETCYEGMHVRAATRRYASAAIPGARRRKIMSCPKLTPSRSGSRPTSSWGVTGDCTWTWQPRKAGGKAVSKRIACKDVLTIPRVPFALDHANSGVSVRVALPDGRELADPEVVVEDLFIVALGDSFASGESNPDRPVQFSASREMLYDPTLVTEQVATRRPLARCGRGATVWLPAKISTIRRCCRGDL